MPTLAQNSVKSYLGVALETTKGTAVTPANFVPITLNSFKPVDVIAPLYDNGIRGSLVENYNYVQGRKHTTVDFGGPVFADTIGYWIAGVLGDVTTTGSAAPYTHTIALKNTVASTSDAQPKALTITDFYGAGTRYNPGQQITDLGLTFNADGMLEYTVKAMGFPSSTTSAPTPSFTTVLPTQVWTGVVTIGGSSVAYVRTGTLDLARKSEAIFGLSNTQAPYQVFLGALTVKGKITFVMQDDTELTRYLSNTQPALTFNFSTGSGSTATQVAFTISKGAYVTGAIERNNDYVEVTVDIEGLGNTTDVGASAGYSPIKFTLQNALPSGTFQ
jgi:Phage tail tube protein